jgi:hypothetical protein
MAVDVHREGSKWSWRVCRPVGADLHNFNKEQKAKWNTVILTVLLFLFCDYRFGLVLRIRIWDLVNPNSDDHDKKKNSTGEKVTCGPGWGGGGFL